MVCSDITFNNLINTSSTSLPNEIGYSSSFPNEIGYSSSMPNVFDFYPPKKSFEVNLAYTNLPELQEQNNVFRLMDNEAKIYIQSLSKKGASAAKILHEISRLISLSE